MSFRVEYRRQGGPSVFQRNVRFHVDITAAHDAPPHYGKGNPGVYCVSFTLISGPLRRFKRICEHIQSQILGRRPTASSPRMSRRPPSDMSDSSSCGSETLSPPPPPPNRGVSDDMALPQKNQNQTTSAVLARCKSDTQHDSVSDAFEEGTERHRRVGSTVSNGNGRRNFDKKV